MTDFLHGIEVVEIEQGDRPIETVSSSIIAICGTAPGAQAAATAQLLTGVEANDNALTWQAASAGNAGNNVEIYLRNPFANSASLAVTVIGTLIIVDLATDAGGLITSTAADIKTAIDGHAQAPTLVSVVNTGASDGTGVVVALSKQTPLAGGADEAFPLNTPALVAGSRIEAAKLGTEGTLPPALDAIFDQYGAVVVVVRVQDDVDPAVELANVIGGATESGGTGIHAFKDAESVVFVAPKILIAPGYTNELACAQELSGIANELAAMGVIDGNNTDDADVKAYRTNFGSSRLYLLDPHCRVFDVVNNVEVSQPSSSRVAGLMAKTDNEQGFQHSPSNREITGIIGTDRAISGAGVKSGRANLLNENEVATIIRRDGFRLWGNRTCSSDPKFKFINVRRTADIIQESVARAHQWAIDRNITATYIDSVLESVNGYIRGLVAEEIIVGGSIVANPDLNTAASLALGKVYFDIEFTPYPPAEHIIFRFSITNERLIEVLPQTVAA